MISTDKGLVQWLISANHMPNYEFQLSFWGLSGILMLGLILQIFSSLWVRWAVFTLDSTDLSAVGADKYPKMSEAARKTSLQRFQVSKAASRDREILEESSKCESLPHWSTTDQTQPGREMSLTAFDRVRQKQLRVPTGCRFPLCFPSQFFLLINRIREKSGQNLITTGLS